MRLTDMTNSSLMPQLIEEISNKVAEEKEKYILETLYRLDIDPDILINQMQEIRRLNDILEEYKDLEEQGLLLKLPCKVGDVVWFNTYKRGERMSVQSHKVEEVRVRVLIERDYAEPYTEIPDYEFGKTVFLTREEAEQKLKELEE